MAFPTISAGNLLKANAAYIQTQTCERNKHKWNTWRFFCLNDIRKNAHLEAFRCAVWNRPAMVSCRKWPCTFWDMSIPILQVSRTVISYLQNMHLLEKLDIKVFVQWRVLYSSVMTTCLTSINERMCFLQHGSTCVKKLCGNESLNSEGSIPQLTTIITLHSLLNTISTVKEY